ncbi:MAG: hypothetical protein IPH24_09405 [Crocinitomicaceae bacterium]|nr:hypothetical protein [Crocinitomicaceae bacterium]
MKKRLLKIVSTLLALILLTEVGLRIFLDNEDRVLYLEDAKCEYRLAPNQAVFRFHNLYQTNEYGMRSVSVKKRRKRESYYLEIRSSMEGQNWIRRKF